MITYIKTSSKRKLFIRLRLIIILLLIAFLTLPNWSYKNLVEPKELVLLITNMAGIFCIYKLIHCFVFTKGFFSEQKYLLYETLIHPLILIYFGLSIYYLINVIGYLKITNYDNPLLFKFLYGYYLLLWFLIFFFFKYAIIFVKLIVMWRGYKTVETKEFEIYHLTNKHYYYYIKYTFEINNNKYTSKGEISDYKYEDIIEGKEKLKIIYSIANPKINIIAQPN